MTLELVADLDVFETEEAYQKAAEAELFEVYYRLVLAGSLTPEQIEVMGDIHKTWHADFRQELTERIENAARNMCHLAARVRAGVGPLTEEERMRRADRERKGQAYWEKARRGRAAKIKRGTSWK